MAGEGVTQGSTLYAGSVSQSAIYELTAGAGFAWGSHVQTEVLVDSKPRQLTRAEDSGTALAANVKNPRDADFASSTWVTTIDGRQLSVTDIYARKPFDVQDWKNTFPEFQPSGLSIDLQANPQIKDVVFRMSMDKIKNEINAMHSSGSGSLWDGFETLILADVDCTQVGTPAVLTISNILDYSFDLRDAIDPRLRNSPNLKFFMSYADADLFDRAARATNTATVLTSARGEVTMTQANGSMINIVPMEGISKNFVFATIASTGDDSNLVQGVWMEKDTETLKMYRSEEGDQEWKILFRASLGVQHKSGKDIWYLNNV